MHVIEADRLDDPVLADELIQLAADLYVVVAFRILPPSIFGIPRLGAMNLHASLLLKYRGAAPINWALINGESETGVTTFLIQERVDTGNILIQERIQIEPEDNAGTLHDKLAHAGSHVVLDSVNQLETGSVKLISQDAAKVTRAPKIHKEFCRINWTMPAQKVHDFIRGLSPYPCAFTISRWSNTQNSGIAPDRVFRDRCTGDSFAPERERTGCDLRGWVFA